MNLVPSGTDLHIWIGCLWSLAVLFGSHLASHVDNWVSIDSDRPCVAEGNTAGAV